MGWQVYIILCSDQSLYTGISNNVLKRYQQHACQKGAKYFRGRSPLQLVYVEGGHNRSSASKREHAIKKLKSAQKIALIATASNGVAAFF
ncbi:MAG: GIY-YIG nuclease family protein [Methylococcaceae bacterium]|nr:GIY-YIG nuclease family protein [Methylococcaceae bacterium]